MKPSELSEVLHALISERVPLHICGACGVGISQIVAQVAADHQCTFLDVRALQLDPVDLHGLPRISADRAEWVRPKFLPLDGEGILFLDELTSAPQMTQAGCYPRRCQIEDGLTEGGHVLEGMTLALDVVQISIGGAEDFVWQFELTIGRIEIDEPAGIAVRQGADQHGVHEAEDGRAGADAEGKREHRGNGEARALAQGA